MSSNGFKKDIVLALSGIAMAIGATILHAEKNIIGFFVCEGRIIALNTETGVVSNWYNEQFVLYRDSNEDFGVLRIGRPKINKPKRLGSLKTVALIDYQETEQEFRWQEKESRKEFILDRSTGDLRIKKSGIETLITFGERNSFSCSYGRSAKAAFWEHYEKMQTKF
jgi:hypothetical protein